MKRYDILKKFPEYVQKKDTRSMDEICVSNDTEFKLQAQQMFLKDYMVKYPNWKSMLMYHEIGSGKTCTAIVMAAEYMRTHPGARVKVILPARLRTNYIDELISPCGMDAFISKAEFTAYHSSTSSDYMRKKIRKKFMSAISETYDIMSFEKLKIEAMKQRDDLITWSKDFTKNCMIVVDEVHNLLGGTYVVKESDLIQLTGVAKKGTKGMNSVLFKMLTKYADPSCKMIFLTATPVFDNIGQFKEVVQAMSPEVGKIHGSSKISSIIDLLRGKVSYFPGTSRNAYPSVEYVAHDIPLTKLQDIKSSEVASKDSENENDEAFMALQRQISISVTNNPLENPAKFCPKIKAIMDVIKSSQGKHIVYSNFIQVGLRIVEEALRRLGYKSLAEVAAEDSWEANKDKIFARWDGSVSDIDKQYIKSIANNSNNIDGGKLRVILGSPSIKEGVSFKHVQHVHLLDPMWNTSAKAQVEGRAIRFCSHVDVMPSHAPLRRTVVVHMYKSVPRNKGLVQQTCDQKIYDFIMPHKASLVKAGEAALKKVAIDYYLFRDLYVEPEDQEPVVNVKGMSPVVLEDVKLGRSNRGSNSNTCPKKRRPPCGEGHVQRKNKQDKPCCYKQK